MNKKDAKKLVQRDVSYLVDSIFECVEREHAQEHGGWEACDAKLCKAMLALGEDDTAVAVRDAMIVYLKTDAGLALVKKNQRPHYNYAQGLVGTNECEHNQGCPHREDPIWDGEKEEG